jgi:hypothetical protein
MSDTAERDWINERKEVLEVSTTAEELEFAATELAASDNPEALDVLGTFLRRAEFLARLDDVADPSEKTFHLRGVLRPLIERPSPEVARLCLQLANDPVFLADDDRKSFLLRALCGVTPMSADTVELFHRTNDEGYFAFNAPLLAANGSPRALELFAMMIEDPNSPLDERVDCLHVSILPHRIRLPILKMVSGLMARSLEPPVATAVIESVFDYRVEWFRTHPPAPPGWRTASEDVLRFLIDLSARAKAEPNVPLELEEAIDKTVYVARALLARRTL